MRKLFTSFMVLSLFFIGTSTFAVEKIMPIADVPDASTEQWQDQITSTADKLNINTATATEIQKILVGVGIKKAESIVQHREKHGNFTDAEQLLEVPGIGKVILEKNKDKISF